MRRTIRYYICSSCDTSIDFESGEPALPMRGAEKLMGNMSCLECHDRGTYARLARVIMEDFDRLDLVTLIAKQRGWNSLELNETMTVTFGDSRYEIKKVK